MSYDIYLNDAQGEHVADYNWLRNMFSFRSVMLWQFGIDVTGMLPEKSYVEYKEFDRKALLETALRIKNIAIARKEMQPEFTKWVLGEEMPPAWTREPLIRYNWDYYMKRLDQWIKFCETAQNEALSLYVSD